MLSLWKWVKMSTAGTSSVILYGETTRELYDAWHARVGATRVIPQTMIQPLFNDIGLYPCTSQVWFEWLKGFLWKSEWTNLEYIVVGLFDQISSVDDKLYWYPILLLILVNIIPLQKIPSDMYKEMNFGFKSINKLNVTKICKKNTKFN